MAPIKITDANVEKVKDLFAQMKVHDHPPEVSALLVVAAQLEELMACLDRISEEIKSSRPMV